MFLSIFFAFSYGVDMDFEMLQVGSYFVEQYYHVLRQQPDLVHQFYSEASSMIRVDGDSSETASTMLVLVVFNSYANVSIFVY